MVTTTTATGAPRDRTDSTARARQPLPDKFEARRTELADAALRTLGEFGYAKTTLREIAHHTEFTHGVLHYYFSDKHELIAYCVRQYKMSCATRFDALVATAATADELLVGFVDQLIGTLHADAPMHRLWYDLRSQAMFEIALRDDVRQIDLRLEQMIWAVVSRYGELTGTHIEATPGVTYGLVDGIFQQALVRETLGDPEAPHQLAVGVAWLLRSLTRTTIDPRRNLS